MDRFLACTESATIVHLADNVATGEARYSYTFIDGVSWYIHTGTGGETSGAHAENSLRVRIPGKDAFLPVAGDYIVHGIVRGITRTSDLNAYEHYRITDIADNRRGHLPHVAVTAR